MTVLIPCVTYVMIYMDYEVCVIACIRGPQTFSLGGHMTVPASSDTGDSGGVHDRHLGCYMSRCPVQWSHPSRRPTLRHCACAHDNSMGWQPLFVAVLRSRTIRQVKNARQMMLPHRSMLMSMWKHDLTGYCHLPKRSTCIDLCGSML